MDWCKKNNMDLNADKTKEIIVDFRRSRPSHTSLFINDTAVEVLSSTRFLGVHITDNLNCMLFLLYCQSRKSMKVI